MDFGKRIRQQREKLNLSQKDVAKLLFVTRQTVSNWEHGKSLPDMQTLIELSRIFHISIDSLLKEDKKLKEYLDREKTINRYSPFSILIGYEVGFYMIIEPSIHAAGFWQSLAQIGILLSFLGMMTADLVFSEYLDPNAISILKFIRKHYIILGITFLLLVIFVIGYGQSPIFDDKSNYYWGIGIVILMTVLLIIKCLTWLVVWLTKRQEKKWESIKTEAKK